jgi:outer membrane protein assembly factor BamB
MHCLAAAIARSTALLCLAALAACGGGGGDAASTSGGAGAGGATGTGSAASGGNSAASLPYIEATVVAFPSNAVPPGLIATGFNAGASVQITTQTATGAPITNATASVNGTPLVYVVASQDYEGDLNVAPGQAVSVSITIAGAAYAASLTEFTRFPGITAPAVNETWSAATENLIGWSAAIPNSNANYVAGVFDPIGNLIWPGNDSLQPVPAGQTSFSVGANSLSPGTRQVHVGVLAVAQFPGAASGSGFALGAFNYVPITVIRAFPTLRSVSATPGSINLSPGKSFQLSATGEYSDGSTQNLGTRATWTSSDPNKVTVDAAGTVTGVAAGTASVTAAFGGFSASTSINVFQPNPSPSPPLSESVTYQIDYAHTGRASVGGSGPTFPPLAHWSTTLNGNISYPLIAGGKVFVVTDVSSSGGVSGTTLYALDETTGAVAWGPTPLSGTYSFAGLAYDHGTIFAVNYDGLVRTFDARTGVAGWSKQLLAPNGVTSPPTAVNGILYVAGEALLTAVDETNGKVLWSASAGTARSAPTVSQDGLFIAGPCDVRRFDPIVGNQVWWYNAGCSGGGGKTAAFANNSLYVRRLGSPPSEQVFDVTSGKPTGRFVATPIPAFGDTLGFFVDSARISAIDQPSGLTQWTFAGDGLLSSAPIVIDNTVVIGSSSGTVYALSASNGNVLWSGPAGAPIDPPDEQNSTIVTGFGVGDGYLVVPAGKVLNGWRLVP